MKGLILDTSTNTTIVGIVDDGRLEKITLLDGGRGLSSSLFPAIAPLANALSFIAVGTGPGSYMGVRTGATIAKVLAYSKSIPLIEFPSVLISLPRDLSGPFIYVGDAKMGESFLIEGMALDGKIANLSSPRLVSNTLLEQQQPKGRLLIGKDLTAPHLYWVAAHVNEALSQNKILLPEELTLSYMR